MQRTHGGLALLVLAGTVAAVAIAGGYPATVGILTNSERTNATMAARDVTITNLSVQPATIDDNSTGDITVKVEATNSENVTSGATLTIADETITSTDGACTDSTAVCEFTFNRTELLDAVGHNPGQYEFKLTVHWTYGFDAVTRGTIDVTDDSETKLNPSDHRIHGEKRAKIRSG